MADNFAIRSTALSLHTDLKALDDYTKHPGVARALIEVARAKVAEITAHLNNLEINLAFEANNPPSPVVHPIALDPAA